jgi:hypothetical protein
MRTTPPSIRIAFALNNISQGTDLLLDAFIQLVRTSTKAQENVAEWAAQLYRTPPPPGPRRGLSFLRSLVEGLDTQKRADLKEMLALAGCPTDDRFIDGVERGHVLLLGKFLAARSFQTYRASGAGPFCLFARKDTSKRFLFQMPRSTTSSWLTAHSG